MEFTVRSYCEAQYNSVVREPTSALHSQNLYTYSNHAHTNTHALFDLKTAPNPDTVSFCKYLLWASFLNNVGAVHNEMTLHTLRHGYMHTVLHAHIFVSLFWPAGHFLPNWPFCFSSSQQRHDCGVVASQSVAACGFPRVSFSFRLSSPLFLSRPPPPLCFPLILSPALSLLLYYFCFLSFFLQISPSLFPPLSFSLSGSFCLFPFFFQAQV